MLVEAVKKALDETLSDLDCGLEVDRVTLRELRPPDEVKPAFDKVLADVAGDGRSCASAPSASARRCSSRPPAKSAFSSGDDMEKWWAAKDANNTEEMKKYEDEMSKTFQSAGGQVQHRPRGGEDVRNSGRRIGQRR